MRGDLRELEEIRGDGGQIPAVPDHRKHDGRFAAATASGPKPECERGLEAGYLRPGEAGGDAMKLGLENKKKTGFLVVLLLLVVYLLYTNVLSGPSAPSDTPRTMTAAAVADRETPPPIAQVASPGATRPQALRSGGEDFHPV